MSKERVLVVDDEASIRQLLSQKLSSEGFSCESCSSGEEALLVLQSQPFDAIISDLHMPGISGLKLLEETRAKHSHLAFLMGTGENDIQLGIEAMKQGAADYLVKPLELGGVVRALKRALETKRLEEEVANYRQHLEEMVKQGTRQLHAAMKRVEETYDETLEALARVKQLQGLLPICSYCKKVQNDRNYWQQIESYVADHSEAKFSHGVCPDCYVRFVGPQLERPFNPEDAES